jgi:hypothetical protein
MREASELARLKADILFRSPLIDEWTTRKLIVEIDRERDTTLRIIGLVSKELNHLDNKDD